MSTLHLVSHTHWDREWYLTFQQFRLRLVHLIDGLLKLLESDPEFKYYMLDGQTIVLEDYLEIRPEKAETIQTYVKQGRLLIGPWHVLPDEFLVSPEAIIRNLLHGSIVARQFGPKMDIGYIPDPFGHIGQMPQILNQFGIDTAVFRRGLSDEPCEIWWEAPDGSSVLSFYLRDGYDNAARLPVSDGDQFVAEIQRLRDSLAPHSKVDHILLMHGTDHMEPPGDTTDAIAYAQKRLESDDLILSTLPLFIAAVRSEISDNKLEEDIPTFTGELRSPKRHHLLPGVLSTRMWIKQRNHRCETLLEKWAEPFSTWAGYMTSKENGNAAQPIQHAWQILLKCHPHDSICGCSIDQVHEEMRTRFDQVEQIGEEITQQSLITLARQIAYLFPPSNILAFIVVFNATSNITNGVTGVAVEISDSIEHFQIIDQDGLVVPFQVVGERIEEVGHYFLNREGLKNFLGLLRTGFVQRLAIQEIRHAEEGDHLFVTISLSRTSEPDHSVLKEGLKKLTNFLTDDNIKSFDIVLRTMRTMDLLLSAQDVPGWGYVTYRVAASEKNQQTNQQAVQENGIVENEYFSVQVSPDDGALTIHDKQKGTIYHGLNRFADSGDRGDTYNYCPPEKDTHVHAQVKSIHTDRGEVRQTLTVSLELHAPIGLTKDRKARSGKKAPIRIITKISLLKGIRRIEISTEVDNPVRDHRLRVHFPTPFTSTSANYDGHFEVVQRPIELPDFDESWVEQPVPQVPQRAFADVSDGTKGLMVANRGLPEIETLYGESGNTEIALTLLRCVGWLSLDDYPCRKGHAGPPIATPGAQMLGKHTFEYAIIPHPGNWQNSFWEAYAFNTPMRAVSLLPHEKERDLPNSTSFLQVEPKTFVVSTVKSSQDGKGWIVRGYNISDETITVTLTPWKHFPRAVEVNMAEEFQRDLAVNSNGSITLTTDPKEIASIQFFH